MSLMKRFELDTEELSERAAAVAQVEDDTARFIALRDVFQDCGARANSYASPMAVARLLVSEVVDIYQEERDNLQMERLIHA